MRGVVPFIGIGNRHGALAERKLHPGLIPGDSHPVILQRKSPARPFCHPIVRWITITGHAGVICHPTHRGCWGPDILGSRFFHRASQRQLLKPLIQEHRLEAMRQCFLTGLAIRVGQFERVRSIDWKRNAGLEDGYRLARRCDLWARQRGAIQLQSDGRRGDRAIPHVQDCAKVGVTARHRA